MQTGEICSVNGLFKPLFIASHFFGKHENCQNRHNQGVANDPPEMGRKVFEISFNRCPPNIDRVGKREEIYKPFESASDKLGINPGTLKPSGYIR